MRSPFKRSRLTESRIKNRPPRLRCQSGSVLLRGLSSITSRFLPLQIGHAHSLPGWRDFTVFAASQKMDKRVGITKKRSIAKVSLIQSACASAAEINSNPANGSTKSMPFQHITNQATSGGSQKLKCDPSKKIIHMHKNPLIRDLIKNSRPSFTVY